MNFYPIDYLLPRLIDAAGGDVTLPLPELLSVDDQVRLLNIVDVPGVGFSIEDDSLHLWLEKTAAGAKKSEKATHCATPS